ncbi:ATP-binding protein [Azonexus fungiphilus]|uniref:ATP-binding protein n=1 Tax=Azonexus fungiphilus TaxID=146940 RepID=UPI001C2C3AF5|nr:ATP-binding protein [Azonexus fungiphilus]
MKPAITSRRVHSLRWRLLAAIGAIVLTTWLLTGWFSYTKAQHEAEELMDGSLAQTARLLLAITHDNEDDLADIVARLETVRGTEDNIYEPPLEFQIGLGDGSILARSPDAPELPILGVADYSDIIRHDAAWRVLNRVSEDGRYRVQVAQAIGLRDRAALEVAVQTVLPLILIVPVLILFIYLSIRRTLRPLEQLADEVAARSPDNLAPLASRRVPTEAQPLLNAINRLFRRVERTLDNERRFTADAAHELRTPLAALKVQTQVARLSGDSPVREHALQQIEVGVDRAGRLVEQLLRLARLDPLSQPPHTVPVDLGRLVNEAVAALPERDRIVLPATSAVVLGDPDLLQIALRNLIDNALRYTAPDRTVEIVIDSGVDNCSLTVNDHGPGVPETMLARLGERFFRGQPGKTEGNGLGLAIVARIAELHAARLRLANRPQGGLSVSLQNLRPTGG